jgi:hypothetical protein
MDWLDALSVSTHLTGPCLTLTPNSNPSHMPSLGFEPATSSRSAPDETRRPSVVVPLAAVPGSAIDRVGEGCVANLSRTCLCCCLVALHTATDTRIVLIVMWCIDDTGYREASEYCGKHVYFGGACMSLCWGVAGVDYSILLTRMQNPIGRPRTSRATIS